MVMFDWLNIVVPLTHNVGIGGPFWAGSKQYIRPDSFDPALVVFSNPRDFWRSVEGSWSKKVSLLSYEDAELGPCLAISGNPAKLFQGHNVFGSCDLLGLCVALAEHCCAHFGVVPSTIDRDLWNSGQIRLQRADLTGSFCLGSLIRVRLGLGQLHRGARLRHRREREGTVKGDSVLFGKGSRRWSLNCYAKGSPSKEGIGDLPSYGGMRGEMLRAYAETLLRCEVRLLAMELDARKLRYVCDWSSVDVLDLFESYRGELEISNVSEVDDALLESLRPALRTAYASWCEGYDMRVLLPRRTFYKFRAELMPHGVDIGISQVHKKKPANVVPIRLVLEGKMAGVPEWAKGTPLFFEPRSLKAV